MKINNIKRIAYVSGTRADFGLMNRTLHLIQSNSAFKLQIYATGMHLMRLFGESISVVKNEFPNVITIPSVFSNDAYASQLYFLNDYISRLTHEFLINKPDMVIILGDRIEMLGTAIVSTYLHIPIIHIHGGDVSGIVDEPVRHAITKLAHVHCAATKKSAIRIQKMGEDLWRIHIIGAPGLDDIFNDTLFSQKEVSNFLGISVKQKYILLTLHPEGQNHKIIVENAKIVVQALQSFILPIVLIYPNVDPGGRAMISFFRKYKKDIICYPHVPRRQFLSIAKYCSIWVGNSSAQNIESCSLHVPCISVGSREHGREHANNLIYSPFKKNMIIRLMKYLLSDTSFHLSIQHIKNPWGNGNTSEKIIQILQSVTINDRLLNKRISY